MRKTKKEKLYEQYLEESLEDEYLYDPETGAKITLEQAESGHWISHDNEFKTIDNSEFEKFQTTEDKEALKALNYLISESEYRKTTLSEEQIQILESTRILSKYDNWSFSNSFKLEFCNGFVFTPTVELHGNTRHQEDFIESQLMFWVISKHDLGHYYLREKKISEKVFDIIRNDDELKLDNYESFTYKKTTNLLHITQILKSLEGQKSLEIELLNNNIFIKTLNLLHLDDILRIEKILKHIC